METETPKRKKGFVTAIAVCIILVIAFGLGFLYARTTPYYSLYVLKKAILNRDTPTVLKYLDTDSILDNMAKDVLAHMDKKEPPRNKFNQHMQNAGKDFVAQLLPQLKQQMGDVLTQFLLSYNNEALFSDLRRLTVFALSADVKDNYAEVRQRGKDKVIFTMAKSPQGHWRITSIDSDELKLFQ